MSAPVSSSVSGGISGSAWVVAGYGLVVLAVLVWIIVARWRLAAGTPGAAVGEVDEQPYAMAYLTGGPERALMAALGSMRVAGAVVAQGREVRADGPLDVNASELERVIHLRATTPIRWDYLGADPTVSRVLEQLRRRLERAGLLLSAEQQRRIKHTGWWMVAVAVLGLPVAAVADRASGAQYLLVLPLVAAVGLLVYAPRHTRRGTAQMERLWTRYTALAGQLRPDWRAHNYGPAYAGLAVGLFGTSALRATGPDFADLVAESYPPRISGGGGAGGGGGGCGSGLSC